MYHDCNKNVISHVCHTSSYPLSLRLSVGRHQGQTIGLLALLCEILCCFPQSLQYIMYWNNCLNQVMTTSCLLVQEAASRHIYSSHEYVSDWTQKIHCYLPSWDLSLFILEVFILTGTVLFFLTGCQLDSGIVYLQTLLQLFIPNMEPGTIYILFSILHGVNYILSKCGSVLKIHAFVPYWPMPCRHFTNNMLLVF